jgi:hypothetical protein
MMQVSYSFRPRFPIVGTIEVLDDATGEPAIKFLTAERSMNSEIGRTDGMTMHD